MLRCHCDFFFKKFKWTLTAIGIFFVSFKARACFLLKLKKCDKILLFQGVNIINYSNFNFKELKLEQAQGSQQNVLKTTCLMSCGMLKNISLETSL